MSYLTSLPGRSQLPLRAGSALLLAFLIHITAWQTLAGIRVLLPQAEEPKTAIEAALLPPARSVTRLPARRAVASTAAGTHRSSSDGPQPLTSVPVPADAHRVPVPAQHASPPAAPPPTSPTAMPAAPDAVALAQKPAADAVSQALAPPQVPSPGAPETAPAASPGAAAPASADALANIAPDKALEPAPIVPLPPAPAAPPGLPPHAAVQVVLPKTARLVYESSGSVRVGGFVLQVRGHTTTRWAFQDGRYKSDLSIDVVNFAQSSQGVFQPDSGLAPERYVETRRRNAVFTTAFDWSGGHVNFSDGNRQAMAEAGAQDRLSVQFQLAVLRQVYPERFVRGAVMPITLAGTKDVSHWTFTVTGEDVVDTGIGRIHALRVLSNRSTETGDESLEVWISERLGWFPVRIRIVDKNRNIIDSVLAEADIN